MPETTTRTPAEVANEADELLKQASRWAIPKDLNRLADLNVEFMLSTAAALDELRGRVDAWQPVADAPAEPGTDTTSAGN